MINETRSDYPIGTKVQYVESGTEVEVVPAAESDEDGYESDTDLFVRMGGIVQHTDVSKIEYAKQNGE